MSGYARCYWQQAQSPPSGAASCESSNPAVSRSCCFAFADTRLCDQIFTFTQGSITLTLDHSAVRSVVDRPPGRCRPDGGTARAPPAARPSRPREGDDARPHGRDTTQVAHRVACSTTVQPLKQGLSPRVPIRRATCVSVRVQDHRAPTTRCYRVVTQTTHAELSRLLSSTWRSAAAR